MYWSKLRTDAAISVDDLARMVSELVVCRCRTIDMANKTDTTAKMNSATAICTKVTPLPLRTPAQ